MQGCFCCGCGDGDGGGDDGDGGGGGKRVGGGAGWWWVGWGVGVNRQHFILDRSADLIVMLHEPLRDFEKWPKENVTA